MIAQPRKNIMDMFIDGARRGFTIATTSLLPNVVMAFVIIQALKVTGLLDIVGNVCEPVMALWGLPGAAATVLLASVMSMGGGVGSAPVWSPPAHSTVTMPPSCCPPSI